MTRRWLSLALTLAAGCSGSNTKGFTAICGADSQSCAVSSDCRLGYVCEKDAAGAGCCRPYTGCTADSCGAGQVCLEDSTCHSVASACSTAACQCAIVGDAGELEVAGQPRLVFAGGASRAMSAVLSITNGRVLPGASFTWSIEGGAGSFSVDASGVVTATTTATTSEPALTADAGNGVTCRATLVNLGAAPAGALVRVYVFDDVTGAPVEGARVVVGLTGTAADDGAAPPTDARGVTTTASGLSGPYDVTVFKEGYDYVTVAGLAASTNDLAIPVSARPVDATAQPVGGFSGVADWTTYEALSGKRQIRGLLAGASVPLRSLLTLDLTTLVGQPPPTACAPTDGPAQGCYPLTFPGQAASQTIGLPGGMTLSLLGSAVKSSFDVTAAPGRRHAWGFAADLALTDVGPLLTTLTGGSAATTPMDLGQVLTTLTPLLPQFASAVHSDLPLKAVPFSLWSSYVAVTYGSRSPDLTARFPQLDATSSYGGLVARELFSRFTDFAAPALPPDPMNPGQTLEGLVVLTGVDAAGHGFVPLGFGVGLDCTTSHCLDRAGYPGDFDGHVNGATVCTGTACATNPAFPAGGVLPVDHVAVFHARAHSGLEGQPWVTLVLATPISGLSAAGVAASPLRATGYVLRREPAVGADTLPPSFGAFPALPATQPRHGYEFTPAAGAHVNWVTLTATAPSATAPAPRIRWNVYAANATTSLRLPTPPTGPDPFGAASAPAATVGVSHVALRLVPGAPSLDELARHGGGGLANLAGYVDGLSVMTNNAVPVP